MWPWSTKPVIKVFDLLAIATSPTYDWFCAPGSQNEVKLTVL